MIDNKKEAIIFRQVKYTIIDCLQDDYDEEDFQVVVDTREQCIINWDLGKIEIDFKNKYITLNDDMTFVFDEYDVTGDNSDFFDNIRDFYNKNKIVLSRSKYYINNRIKMGLMEPKEPFIEFKYVS